MSDVIFLHSLAFFCLYIDFKWSLQSESNGTVKKLCVSEENLEHNIEKQQIL